MIRRTYFFSSVVTLRDGSIGRQDGTIWFKSWLPLGQRDVRSRVRAESAEDFSRESGQEIKPSDINLVALNRMRRWL